eukprot:TRINITY_DN8369_c0_g1_i1.p1 TRINITY_DN8369_c0_g1~~TRINITY_DN8369_c0_g1_i1.p1  ORF type:complete len:197 (-),score=45.66 TRINITY_DN8369_c0_g1_i1:58-648(-)
MENARVLSEEVLGAGRFLNLKCVTYTDANGVERKWEVTNRTSNNKNAVDGVDIIAIVKKKNEEDKLVLIKQFRPPMNKIVVEFPAGLVDDQQHSAGQTALRELKEETGYIGKVIGVSPEAAYEPGLTSSNLNIVHIEIDGDDEKNLGETEFDDAEFIETMLIPISELSEFLIEQGKKGYVIDAKVWTFAFGLSLKK